MLLSAIISLFIIPTLYNVQLNFNGFLNLNNLSNFQSPEALSKLEDTAPEKLFTDYLDIKITAKSAIAVASNSGKILYQKNENDILPIASITKLMTALVFLDNNPGWQKEFYTIPSDRRNGGIIYLNTGEILTIKDLFYTALIVSDNDAAMALSRASGLAEQEFINQMNVKARTLGLTNTYFADPTGLKIENNSNVKDLVKLLNFVLANEEIKAATSTSYYEFKVRGSNKTRTVKLKNTDWLLKSYLNVIGGKTGSLEQAGYCLAVKINGENNQDIIIVVLGSQSNNDRFQDVKAISDWVFSNYKWK
ncbi:MAG: hypothetical protein A2Y82_00700 [Candidatus Buchananbacteria bacterium RBG_13_36_9]|uniref:Peptidase S11 D-alanyl-D-alanine carboxypeptidase A N-terminal domain-containing protein n=1 Tax=Candidatus Buchananbacteria bacterium RBG_13_36_9 TaxID=1797530 RepID=A0A1G1XPG6_9BACT|nr:MAG: hypothetical protein A2Y82_00700 [Candidatus Buchananbacteria bacterium RBG_13_36_9]